MELFAQLHVGASLDHSPRSFSKGRGDVLYVMYRQAFSQPSTMLKKVWPMTSL